MTVKDLTLLGFKAISLPSENREIRGAYVGDLLSWVMGRAKADDAWITIMSNVNVLAVASLADVACVILAEGVAFDQDCIDKAIEKNINVLISDMPIFETAVEISKNI